MNLLLILGICTGIIVGYAIGIFADRYLLPFGDAILQGFLNNKTLETTEVQRDITIVEKDIHDVRITMQQSETNAIGYHFEPIVESIHEEELEDKQIGFRRDTTT